MLLYLTADQVGIQSGGGVVTQNESTALLDLAVERGEEFVCWDRKVLEGSGEDPWKWDEQAYNKIDETWRVMAGTGSARPGSALLEEKGEFYSPFSLCHVYAGTFSKTVNLLKKNGCKVTYTAAAHDISLSQREHERLGLKFDYPHLTDAALWDRYVEGYRTASTIICPSNHSAECMRRYGCERTIVIPHGVDIPESQPRYQPPRTHKFVVGYLGAVGPDKGLLYLLQAWKQLAWQDAVLVLGGPHSDSPFVRALLQQYGGGNIHLLGWVEDLSYFYASLDLYIQPSVTEGFGIEVLEAMAHGRAVLCSRGAGAVDVLPEAWNFRPADVHRLAEAIHDMRKRDLQMIGQINRELAREYEWPLIRKRYQKVWESLL